MIVSLFLSVAFSVSAADEIPLTANTVFVPGTTYTINSKLELGYLASLVNAGQKGAGCTFILTSEIILSGNWTPIGNATYDFNGTFDGRRHTVSGLYINTAGNRQGLFGYTTGTVQNVIIIGASINGNTDIGSIAGYNDGIISNCVGGGAIAGNGNIGGITGYNNGIVSDCNYTGTVHGTSVIGGIIGNNHSVILDCYNNGTVSGDFDVGGIAGQNYQKIQNCYNNGFITCNIMSGGGITGGNDYSTMLVNCYNTGDISGSGVVIGGINGWNCGNIINCYNIGSVSGSVADARIGSITGYIDTGTVQYCYWLNNTGVTSKTPA